MRDLTGFGASVAKEAIDRTSNCFPAARHRRLLWLGLHGPGQRGRQAGHGVAVGYHHLGCFHGPAFRDLCHGRVPALG